MKQDQRTQNRFRVDTNIKVIDPRDGHVYYLINAQGNKGVCNVVFLETYHSLHQQDDRSGFFFVADATDDPSGTVHRGWAVYIWDELHGKWIKISEQETVEGVWGIDEELLGKYLLISEFNKFYAAYQEWKTLVNNKNRIQDITINNLREKVAILWEVKHTHANKAVLDALSDKFGNLYYNDVLIGGNSYVYDRAENGKLVWQEPGSKEVPVEVRNSTIIAEQFANTFIARPGMSLFVIEVDGSISIFKMVVDGVDEEGVRILKPVFAQTIIKDVTSGVVESVEYLPEATLALVGRGFFVPRRPQEGYPEGHLYKCIEYIGEDGEFHAKWQDYTYTEASTIATEGAKITTCWLEDYTMWKKARITWKDPAVESTVEGEAEVHKWKKTVLVRKFGSSPLNAGDGTVVCTNFINGLYSESAFTDFIPYTQGEDVYYKAFSFTERDCNYTADSGEYKCEMLNWAKIKSYAEAGLLTKVFEVGDELVLPKHKTYGEICCKITRIGAKFMELESNDVICQKEIDAVEEGYVKTEDVTVDSNKEYCRKVVDEEGNVSYEIENNPTDSDLPNLYEYEQENPDVINDDGSVKGGRLHGSSFFPHSNLLQWLNATSDGWFEKKSPWDTAPSYAGEMGFLGGFIEENLDSLEELYPLQDMITGISIPYEFNDEPKSMNHSIDPVDWQTRLLEDGKFLSGFEDGESKYPEEKVGVVLHVTLGEVPDEEEGYFR